MRLLRPLVLATVSLFLLNSCTPTQKRSATFQPRQTWNVQGRDDGQLVYARVTTRDFRVYTMDKPEVSSGGKAAQVQVRSNLEPLNTVRLLFPGGTPMVIQEVASGQTDFLWNGGKAGVVYRCRTMDRQTRADWVAGSLTRVENGEDITLGTCGAQLQ